MSNVVEPTILPFKCQDVLVKLGSSCKKQEEIYNNLYNLNTGVTTLAPNSVPIGSGLGDASWNEALNYEKIQAELTEKLSEEAKQNAGQNIVEIQDKNKNKDVYLYGISFVVIAGVILYELSNKK